MRDQVDGEVAARGEHHPHARLLQPHADDPNRADERERGADQRHHREPEAERGEAEHLVGHAVGEQGHRPQLEAGPADELQDVHHRRAVAAVTAEHRSQQHHGGDAAVVTGRGDERQQQRPGDRADRDGEQRGAEAQAEPAGVGRGDEERAAASTSTPIARSPQSTPMSKARRRRSSAGTGRMPTVESSSPGGAACPVLPGAETAAIPAPFAGMTRIRSKGRQPRAGLQPDRPGSPVSGVSLGSGRGEAHGVGEGDGFVLDHAGHDRAHAREQAVAPVVAQRAPRGEGELVGACLDASRRRVPVARFDTRGRPPTRPPTIPGWFGAPPPGPRR